MATVLRASTSCEQSPDSVLRTVAFSFEDMAGQADNYLDTVRNEAAKIIQKAKQEAERVRLDAAESGRQAAMQAAEKVLDEKVAKHMATLLPAMEKAACEIQDAKHAWLNQWEKSAVSLAAAIASRVIRRELTTQPEITLELVREALSLAAGAEEITLHINPNDHKNLGSQVERLAESLVQLAPAQIIANGTIEPGGCKITTKFGEIDQRIESQLQRIVEELA